MEFLASKKFSLGCTVLNAFFTGNALLNGDIILAGIFGFFAAVCYYNYSRADG
tara:strand:- start:770 stop:928 length:159 start_codon:yes stop_codon:yes gene_type:complete